MTYAIIDRIQGGDQHEELCPTYSWALDAATSQWAHLSAYDKRRREYFAVMSGELDEDGCFDLNTAKELAVFTTAKKERVSVNPYNFDELRAKAISRDSSAEDRLALYEWMSQYGRRHWNGECFDIGDRYTLWPVYDDDEAEDAERIDAEVRYI